MVEVVKFKFEGIQSSLAKLSLGSSQEEVETWKFRVQQMLEEKDLWEAVETDLRRTQYFWKNKKAIHLISSCLYDNMIPVIKAGKTAKAVWDIIDSIEFTKDGFSTPTVISQESTKRTINPLGEEKTKLNPTNRARESRDYSSFVNAESTPVMTNEVRKMNNQVKSSVAAAEAIGNNQEVVSKLTKILKDSSKGNVSAEEKTLLDSVKELYINLTNAVKQPTMRFICEIAGESLINMAKSGGANGIAEASCWIIGNLIKYSESVVCLKPKGLITLYVNLTKGSAAAARRGINGLEICLKHLPGLVGDPVFQKAMLNVAEKCVDIVKTGYGVAANAVSSALAVLGKVTKYVADNFGIWAQNTIKQSLHWLLGFISFNGQNRDRDVSRTMKNCVEIMHYVGGADVKEYVKSNYEDLNQEAIKVYYEREKDGIFGDLFKWFNEIVLVTLMFMNRGFGAVCDFVDENPKTSVGIAVGAGLIAGLAYMALNKRN